MLLNWSVSLFAVFSTVSSTSIATGFCSDTLSSLGVSQSIFSSLLTLSDFRRTWLLEVAALLEELGSTVVITMPALGDEESLTGDEVGPLSPGDELLPSNGVVLSPVDEPLSCSEAPLLVDEGLFASGETPCTEGLSLSVAGGARLLAPGAVEITPGVGFILVVVAAVESLKE